MEQNKIADTLQTWDTNMLLLVANQKINIVALTKNEIANRGLDKSGVWIGFDKAEKLWRVK